LHNHAAIARQHSFERSQRAVYASEVCHFCYPPKFLRRHFSNWRKDRDHRVIDPDVDLAQLGLDLLRCGVDVIGLRKIEKYDQCSTAELFHFFTCRFQSVATSRKQREARASPCKLQCGRTPDASRRAGDHHRLDCIIH
jgi:hypothetical protein